jgi:hypothetical protein
VYASLEQRGQLRKEEFERGGPGSIQAFVDGLIADGDGRARPEATRGEETPDGKAGGGLAQSADEEGAPEEEGREDARATGAIVVGVVDSGTKVSEERLEKALNVRQQGLIGGGGQGREERRGLVKVKIRLHLPSMPPPSFIGNPDEGN